MMVPLHLACAEVAKVDVFLTTDDGLRRLTDKNREHLSVEVANPLKWLEGRAGL